MKKWFNRRNMKSSEWKIRKLAKHRKHEKKTTKSPVFNRKYGKINHFCSSFCRHTRAPLEPEAMALRSKVLPLLSAAIPGLFFYHILRKKQRKLVFPFSKT